jgi:peptidoglycan/LPS O-acetylase OafA/YrhL
MYEMNDLKHFLLQVPMASNWFSQGYSFNGPIWSVSVEILVYVLFFALCRLIGTGYVVTIGVLIVAEQFYFWPFITDRFELFREATAYFFAGGLVALVAASANSQTRKAQRVIMYAVIAATTSVLLAAAYRFGIDSEGVTIVAAALSVYVFQLFDFKGRWINNVCATVGSLTYSSYLLQFPLQLLLALLCLIAGSNIPLYQRWFLLLYLGLVFVLAFFCYRLFELPMQNEIRRRYLQARRGDASA